MKKPDIIYVHRGLHLGMLTTTVIKVGAPDEEEYIRKDALLEWAKERYKAIENDNQLGELFKQGVLYELHRVIAKIESL